jgi:hypothetical protein
MRWVLDESGWLLGMFLVLAVSWFVAVMYVHTPGFTESRVIDERHAQSSAATVEAGSDMVTIDVGGTSVRFVPGDGYFESTSDDVVTCFAVREVPCE